MNARTATDIIAISELLRQPYALDPGSLEYLVEQADTLPGGPVQTVCALLGSNSLSALEWENLENCTRHAARQESVRRALERSAKRKGRCPKSHQAWLRRVLAGERKASQISRAPAKETVTTASPTVQTLRSRHLDLSSLEGSIDEFPEVIDRLGALREGPQSIDIGLAGFTYASALAVVAQWILANDLVGNYAFLDCPHQMRKYLENIRFNEALINPKIVVSPDPMDWAVGLTRINRELPTEKVTEKIVDILTTFINPKPDDRSALSVLISEMIENVHRHANAQVDGFAVAQVYPKRLKMGITLVDAGIGVRSRFE